MNKLTKKVNPKHNNQVRIIGGSHRGRKLNFVASEGLRPTPDSVRERLFNWLGQDLTGQCVLDLFSGSGALGFEAASRNAAKIVMCDNNRRTCQQLHYHIQEFSLNNQIKIEHQDGLLYLQNSSKKFDLIFLDPPFGWSKWQEILNLLPSKLNNHGKIYIEAEKLPDLPEWLEIYRQGKAGLSQFVLLLYTQLTD